MRGDGEDDVDRDGINEQRDKMTIAHLDNGRREKSFSKANVRSCVGKLTLR
jgi:hypothetical protein